jgi:hypothetical protein
VGHGEGGCPVSPWSPLRTHALPCPVTARYRRDQKGKVILPWSFGLEWARQTLRSPVSLPCFSFLTGKWGHLLRGPREILCPRDSVSDLKILGSPGTHSSHSAESRQDWEKQPSSGVQWSGMWLLQRVGFTGNGV